MSYEDYSDDERNARIAEIEYILENRLYDTRDEKLSIKRELDELRQVAV